MGKAEEELIKNEIGFWELAKKPTKQELEKFYNNQYFDSKNFEVEYSETELMHKLIPFYEALEVSQKKEGDFLDVGCGEGFSLDFYSKRGWSVTGIDFSSDGVERHFSNHLKHFMAGDIYEQINKLIKDGKSFDLITCNNVLEHLLEPVEFINLFKKLLSPRGVARIQVPNDHSFLQGKAVEMGLANPYFWYAPHEHMSYFTQDTLVRLVEHCDLDVVEVLGDFPIDFFLFNRDSNYLLDSEKGRSCHQARMTIDLLLLEQGPNALVEYRKGCGKAGVGRNAIIYFKRK